MHLPTTSRLTPFLYVHWLPWVLYPHAHTGCLPLIVARSLYFAPYTSSILSRSAKRGARALDSVEARVAGLQPVQPNYSRPW